MTTTQGTIRKAKHLPASKPKGHLVLTRGGLVKIAKQIRTRASAAFLYVHERDPVVMMASSPLAVPVEGWIFAGRYEKTATTAGLACDISFALENKPSGEFWRLASGRSKVDKLADALVEKYGN